MSDECVVCGENVGEKDFYLEPYGDIAEIPDDDVTEIGAGPSIGPFCGLECLVDYEDPTAPEGHYDD